MSVPDARLRELFRNAPRSSRYLLELLQEGLGWPLPDVYALDFDDLLIDWSPEELHLDSAQVARLTSISQLPPLTSKQKFGAFYLRFEGGQLPIGAVRRVVQQLVTSRRGKGGGKAPSWALHDLLFFCHSDGLENIMHIVNFQEKSGKRVLRVLSWTEGARDSRLDLLLRRAAPELSWAGDAGPLVVLEPERVVGFAGYREGIKSAKVLSRRMAEVAQDVRDEVRTLLEVETESGPMRSLYADVRERLIGDITPFRFADVYAQTMVYGLLTARISHPERFKVERSLSALRFDNEFLDAIYARFRDESDGVIDVDELGLSELAEQLAETDVDELLADFGADNQRDDPVVYFYEEFLAQYDPQQRRDLGAFYTPKPVVRYIVKTVDQALKSFGLPLGVADQTTWADYVATHSGIRVPPGAKATDPVVSMFDPANGTGTFLVEWLHQAKMNAGPAGVEAALRHASALEISLASYAVSHLKVSLDLPPGLREKGRLPIFLGDTLGPRRIAKLTGMDDPVGIEGVLANEVKFDRHHNVLIGNPPYDRVESKGTGGFVTAAKPGSADSLFDDISRPAVKATSFAHVASLYNLYVYFWRWAIWKVFEENEGPAVISMITASSWLTGPGFIGLRQIAREVADEIVVLDLGGDTKNSRQDENVFDIQSPVAIVTLIRYGVADRKRPAALRYSRIWGTRSEKLASLDRLSPDDEIAMSSVSSWTAPFVPPSGGADWDSYPALTDLFPWQQPGSKYGRTWPVSPSREVLESRWRELVSLSDLTDRTKAFVAPSSGRDIYTKVNGLERIADLKAGADHRPIVRYGFRSFDRQWAFDDPRMAKTESPSLWASLGERQVFMLSKPTFRLGRGPAAVVSVGVPDLHYFRGSFGGKDVIPLYRDSRLTPNVDPRLLALIAAKHRVSDAKAPAPTLEKLFAYVFGILAGTNYTDRFHEALETPGPRVPLTASADLFEQMSAHGERLLWLQTFGERFSAGRGPFTFGKVKWRSEPTRLPADKGDVAYNSMRQELRVADGVLEGVSERAYGFEVSGMEVIPKWLGYRMNKLVGRAASSGSSLDSIRPESWLDEWSRELAEVVAAIEETLTMVPEGVGILENILSDTLIPASDIPEPPAWTRLPPKSGTGEPVLFPDEDLD